MNAKDLKLQNENLSKLLEDAVDKRDKALDMVRQVEESVKTRDIALMARDKYIKELEDRLEFYENRNCIGPLSGKH